jgi:hypothetical protein
LEDDGDDDPFTFSFCTLLTAFRPGHLGLAISRFISCAHSVLSPDNSFLVDVLKLIRSTEVIPETHLIQFRYLSHHLYLFVTYHVIRCLPAVFSALSQYYGEDVGQAWLRARGEFVLNKWEGFDPSAILAYKSVEALEEAPPEPDDCRFEGGKARRRTRRDIVDFAERQM